MALSLSSCLTEYYSSQNTNQGEDANDDDDDDDGTLKFLWKITKQVINLSPRAASVAYMWEQKYMMQRKKNNVSIFVVKIMDAGTISSH